jgi:hypothetical protein
MDVQSCHRLDRSPSPLVVQTAVGRNRPVLLHFAADVIEDVLPGERSAVECLRDLRPDLVPRAPDLLAQIPAERSEQVRKLFRVPAVLAATRNRRAARAVIVEAVLVSCEVTPYVDWSKVRRPGREVQRVNVDFPVDLLRSIDREARRIGVTRQAFIKLRMSDALVIRNAHNRDSL